MIMSDIPPTQQFGSDADPPNVTEKGEHDTDPTVTNPAYATGHLQNAASNPKFPPIHVIQNVIGMLQPENVPLPSHRELAPFHAMVVTILPHWHCPGAPDPYESVTFNADGIPSGEQQATPMVDDELDELDDELLLDEQHTHPAIDSTVTGMIYTPVSTFVQQYRFSSRPNFRRNTEHR